MLSDKNQSALFLKQEQALGRKWAALCAFNVLVIATYTVDLVSFTAASLGFSSVSIIIVSGLNYSYFSLTSLIK